MRQILIINGPNLNLLGLREKEIYGSFSLADLEQMCRQKYQANLEFFQSNHEGLLIDKIQQFRGDGLILNLGAFTHTSIAIYDAVRFIRQTIPNIKIIEVHISNIYAREDFRHKSYISPICDGVICGLGIGGYLAALDFIVGN